ncbi:MAG: tetrahydrofolate dehydrogenase/cyclohydrolase catalytic domain-containing protein, partial [Pyrinomonadaceae bacterium]
MQKAKLVENAKLLYGQVVAAKIKALVADQVSQWELKYAFRPLLAVVRVGDDPASEIYVRGKIRTTAEVGLTSEHHALPADTSETHLLNLIGGLNSRDEVDGILVQLPLPKQIDETNVIDAIDPAKDVDGFHPINAGRLALGRPVLAP